MQYNVFSIKISLLTENRVELPLLVNSVLTRNSLNTILLLVGQLHQCCIIPRRPFPLPDPARRGGAAGSELGGDPWGDPGAGRGLRLWEEHHHAAVREVLRPRVR